MCGKNTEIVHHGGPRGVDASATRWFGLGGVIFRISRERHPPGRKLSLAHKAHQRARESKLDSINTSMRRGTAGGSGGEATRTRFRSHDTSESRQGSRSYETDQTLSPLVEAIFTREIFSIHSHRSLLPYPAVCLCPRPCPPSPLTRRGCVRRGQLYHGAPKKRRPGE